MSILFEESSFSLNAIEPQPAIFDCFFCLAETPADKRMTRRRQLSHDCCIDLSPKVFVRRTSLTQIQSLTKAAVKTREGGEKGFVDQGTGQTPTSAGAGTAGEVKEEPDNKDNKHLTNTNGDDVNPMEHLTPSQFSDANEIRRAISLNNIWKVRSAVIFTGHLLEYTVC